MDFIASFGEKSGQQVILLQATRLSIGIDTLQGFRQGILPSTIGLDHHHSRDSARGPMSRSVHLCKQRSVPVCPTVLSKSKRAKRKEQAVRQVCALLRASTLPNAQKDVARLKHANAFTQGNDLPWNRQTLFCFQGAEQARGSIPTLAYTVNKAKEGAASSLFLKDRGLRRATPGN